MGIKKQKSGPEEKKKIKLCQSCGAHVQIKHKFCRKCGAKLDIQSPPLKNDIKKKIEKRIQIRKNREKTMNKYSGADVMKNLQNAMLEKQEGLSLILQQKFPFESKDPYSPDIKGIELLEQLNFHEAIAFYESLVSENSSNHRFWNNMGVAFMGMKNRKDALYCYEEALKHNPTYYIGLYNKGAVYYECQQYKNAINCFNETLEINPLCGEAYNDRKIAREEIGQFDFSIGEDFDLMGRGVNLMRARMNLSSALVDIGNGNDAILGHNKIVLKFREQLEDILDAGLTYEEHGNLATAIAHYEEGLILNPEDPVLWFHKAKILSQNKDFDASLECLNNALKYDPIAYNHRMCVLAYKIRATVFMFKGQKSKALSDLDSAESIDPFDSHIKEIRLQFSKIGGFDDKI